MCPRFLRRVVGVSLAPCALAGLLATPAAAQTPEYRTTELAPGVHAVRRARPIPAADANVLVIISDVDVIVVDANLLPSFADAVISEIRRLTPLPVRFVINTHWHSDHHHGNVAYARAFPGVQFIQHPNTRRDILARDLPTIAPNARTAYPAAMAEQQAVLDSGRGADGAPLSEAQRAGIRTTIDLYQRFITEMADAPLVPGTLLVADSLVLHRAGREVVVKHLGRGNTAGDLVVYLPRERIIATGDLMVHPIPFAFFSHLGDWPETLRALRAHDARVILPGHGAPLADWSYADQLIALLEDTWAQVRAAVTAGADLAETRRRVDLSVHLERFAGSDQAARARFDRLFVQPGIEAAFRELQPAP